MPSDFVAGFFGGIAGVLVGHPFDTVKVRLQTQSPTNIKYRGMFHCFTCIVRQESVFGLYKGITSPLMGFSIINAIVYNVYGFCLQKRSYENDISRIFYAGCVAGFVQSFVCTPLELARISLQLQGQGVRPKHFFFYYDPPMHYSGPIDCLKQIYKQQGFRGVMKGLPITIIRDTPCYGIYFASYEYLVRRMSPQGPEHLNSARLLFAGGIAGMLSWLFLYPTDVVKSRYQADETRKYRSVLDCALKSYRAEGIRVFFQGLSLTMFRAFPTNAVAFFTVEWVYRIATWYESLRHENRFDRY